MWDHEGRVEIYLNGSWGTICDDYWDKVDADVTCRQLGYSAAITAVSSAGYGEGTGQIWLDDVQCGGSEHNVLSCANRGVGVHNCGHGEDAGLKCESLVRLVGGITDYEGYQAGGSPRRYGVFGQGVGPLLLDYVRCRGNEHNLLSWNYRSNSTKNLHDRDVGVVCEDNNPVSTNCDRACVDAETRTCVYTWDVTYYYSMNSKCGNCSTNPDDCEIDGCVPLGGRKRPLVTVNKQVPGPKIIVCRGDTIVVNVTNMLDDMNGVTFHWHGMNQNLTPSMDGPSMITHCPIPFATTFTYKFRANNAGTYFWHSHIGPNRSDGLAGPLIIRYAIEVKSEHYDVDDSTHVMFIQDWLEDYTETAHYISYLYGGEETMHVSF
ncbi:laccase-type phenoloxidase [Apostichopus japonicus]|uniref:Laccase-type phenoloxidase n=1 Tax=Stichopus japonicus TaxID=307972 RepID=A0A2G8K609_STIJA|nr:laccase-type phenoloxidase [Apostichopus japonicus]